MPDKKAVFLAFLESQREAYGRELPERLTQIDLLWIQVLNRDKPEEAIATLERCAHSLAGSGATFGFSRMGNAARELELLFESLKDGKDIMNPAMQAQISLATEMLRHSVLNKPGMQADHVSPEKGL